MPTLFLGLSPTNEHKLKKKKNKIYTAIPETKFGSKYRTKLTFCCKK